METFMEMEHLLTLIIDSILVSGKMGSLKDMGYLRGLMGIDMKVSILMDLNMEKGHFSLRMERFLKENGRMVKNMVKVN